VNRETRSEREKKVSAAADAELRRFVEDLAHVKRAELPAALPAPPVTRKVRGRINSGLFTSERQDWETPTDLFQCLDAEFGFELDVCATSANAKCSAFFSPEVDGLRRLWRGVCWMNPPYGSAIRSWMAKAYQSSLEGATVVCLVPARTDTRWWHDFAMRGEIRFLRGRVHFGNGKNSAPFPSAIVVFRPKQYLSTAVACLRTNGKRHRAMDKHHE
jgi:phage N-6-adenine-methyltransferase